MSFADPTENLKPLTDLSLQQLTEQVSRFCTEAQDPGIWLYWQERRRELSEERRRRGRSVVSW